MSHSLSIERKRDENLRHAKHLINHQNGFKLQEREREIIVIEQARSDSHFKTFHRKITPHHIRMAFLLKRDFKTKKKIINRPKANYVHEYTCITNNC